MCYNIKKRNATTPDLRTTIYWQPVVQTVSQGKASFEFYRVLPPFFSFKYHIHSTISKKLLNYVATKLYFIDSYKSDYQ